MAPSLQEKRERLQNKRRQRQDGAGLKQFPCKRFKEVGGGPKILEGGPQNAEGIPKICKGSLGIKGGCPGMCGGVGKQKEKEFGKMKWE